MAVETGMLFHIAQGSLGLAHGPLAQHFPAEQKVEAFRPHALPGQAEHQSVAVHARVHVFAVSTGRTAQHGQIDVRDALHGQRYSGNARGGARLVGGKERRFKRHPGHVDALLPQHQTRQHAVQSARAKPQGPHAFFFLVVHGNYPRR